MTGIAVVTLQLEQPETLSALNQLSLPVQLIIVVTAVVTEESHAAGVVFQAGLILSGPWGPINAVLALLHVAALRRSYPRTVLDIVRRRETTT